MTTTSAAVAPPARQAEPELQPLRSPEAQAQFHILAGELAASRQLPQTAAEEFLKALEFVPDAGLAARATGLALAAGDVKLSLDAAHRWLSIEPSSLEAREVITRTSLRLGREAEAYEQCAAIVEDHPGGKSDGFRYVALLLSQETASSELSLALMSRLVAENPKVAGAWQAQSLLALRFNQIDLAEKSAREALRLQPTSKEAPLLLTGALVKKNDIAGADQAIESVVKGSSTANEIRFGYVRLLIESNQRAHAREQLQKMLKTDPNSGEAHLTLGLLALDERKIDEAEPHFQLLAKGGERAIDAEYYLGRIAEARGQSAQALKQYEKVTSGTQALDAAVRRAGMLAKLGKIDDARTTLRQLRQQYPPLATRLYLAEGEILVESGAFEDALILYKTAIDDSEDPSDLLYARSLVYERMGRIEPAEADLRAVLALSPEDARAMNALGYMLIVHTARLDEAEKLIARALELTPEEPAVIDSMGWLRFRQGRNNEALTLLQRAYERFPDPEVGAHLGEVLWTGGDRDRAQAVWAKALKEAPDNTVLRETMKRLLP